MQSERWAAGAAALLLCCSVQTQAQAQNADAQRIRIGEAELYPSLRIGYVSDDNVARVQNDPVAGDAVVVQPELTFLADRRQITFTAGYAGAFSNGSEPALIWADHRLDAGVDARLGIRQRVQVNAYLSREHEAPGQNVTRGRSQAGDEPVEFNETGLNAAFTYGAANARGNVSAGLRYEERHYTNFSFLTEGLTYASVEPYARFGFRVGGETRAFLELSNQNVGYEDDRRSFNAPGAFTGLLFENAGALQGELRIGARNYDYTDEGALDGTELVIIGRMDYLPSSLTTVSVNLTREIDNATVFPGGEGDFQSVRTFGRLGWRREWSERFTTEAFGQAELRERDCPARDTTTTSAGIEGEISIRRWLRVGASFGVGGRSAQTCPGVAEADAPADEFDRQQVGVHITVTL